jgi:hypothetical protein
MPVLFSAAISYHLVSVSAFPYTSSVNKRIQATQRSLELKAKTGSLRDDFARDEAATKGMLQPTSVTSVSGVCTIGTGIYDVVVNNHGNFGGEQRRRQKKCLAYRT